MNEIGRRGKYSKITPEVRILFMNAINNGMKRKTAMETFNIKRTTALTIIKNEGKLKKKGGKTRVKITDTMMDDLIKEIEDNPFVTLRTMKAFLLKEHSCDVNMSTIARRLEGKLITSKVAKAVKQSRNSSETKQRRLEFVEKYEVAIEEYHIISIDEVNFNLYQHRTIGRSPKGKIYNKFIGKECIYNITSQPGDGITTIDAISPIYGVLFYLITDKTVKNDCFIEFLEGLKTKITMFPTELPYCLLFDNVPFHKCQPVKDTLERLELPFLNTAPNSPFLNPIEYCFSKVKTITKDFNHNLSDDDIIYHKNRMKIKSIREARTDLVFNYIHVAFSQVTAMNCNKWFNRVWKYFPFCREKRDITVNNFIP